MLQRKSEEAATQKHFNDGTQIIMSISYYIGLDVSTTASKAVALGDDGSVIIGEAALHDLLIPQPMWAEQDPNRWWVASAAAIRNLWTQINPQDVRGVGLTGQMLGLTVLDANGEVLRPAILWNDQRSEAECAAITTTVGAEHLHQLIGSTLLPGMTLPKLLWLRTHEPEIYSRIASILLPKDYVRYRLCNVMATDVSDAAGTGLLDMGARQWSDTMMEAADIPAAWLPDVFESSDICGEVTSEGAQATGLLKGTPVIAGAGDQPAQAIGAGVVKHGKASITLGTSGVLFVACDHYQPDPEGRLHTFCHAVLGQWCQMGVMQSAAGSLQWFRDQLCPDKSFVELDELAKQINFGAEGLLFAPYLSGERHPHADAKARGAFVGLTLKHDTGHMARAVMEGVAYAMRDLSVLTRTCGAAPQTAFLSGGAARSALWRQIMADVLEIPLVTNNSEEEAALGAALLAAVGTDCWPTLAKACTVVAKEGSTTVPNSETAEAYRYLHGLFTQLYPALQSVSHSLSNIPRGKD